MPSDAGDKKIRVPVLLGPTAVGKTCCAMDIAAGQGCEIVSCDSRQIYKYLDIGTAKPSAGELATVKHWLIDIVPPSEGYSAFRYAQDAARIIRERAAAGKTVIVCGGSGLYFQALSRGLGPQAAADPGIRRHYEDLAAQQGREAVWERLKKVDPDAARSSHAGNLTRNIRALEVFETMGVPLSELKKHAVPPQDIEFSVTVLGLPRALLYERINKRVDAMIKQGLWDEFRSLRNRGFGREAPGLRCVGYRELFEVEEKAIDLQTAIERIKQNTRHFAKRQITWLRHQVAQTPVDMAAGNAQADAARSVSAFLRRR